MYFNGDKDKQIYFPGIMMSLTSVQSVWTEDSLSTPNQNRKVKLEYE